MTDAEQRETIQCHEMLKPLEPRRQPTTGAGLALRALAIANIRAVAANPPVADQPCVLLLPAPAGKGGHHGND